MLRPISSNGLFRILCQLPGDAPRCVIHYLGEYRSSPITEGASLTLSVSGGAEEIRTPDPLHAKQMLSQLSYGPNNVIGKGFRPGRAVLMVGHGGLEPPTSVLSGPRSNQLS